MVGAEKWQRREINLRFVLINLPKLALFWGGGPRQADTGWSSARVFSGKLPCRECWSREGEKRQKKPRRDLAGFYRSSLCLFALLCAKEIKNTPSVGAQLQG